VLVVEEAKALLLRLQRPNRVLSSIPTSAVYKDDIISVPHRVDAVRILKNLGIDAPSPVRHYYNWPGRFVPYDHQRKTVEFLVQTDKGLVLNDIGTGKTQSALWAADYLMREGLVSKVLILSPLSTLERVWGDSIFQSLVHRRFVVMHGSAEKRRKLLATDSDFYIINHDGFPIIKDESVGMFDLIIVDEAAVYRNPKTNRYRRFANWLDKHPNARLWMMTGTPTPNAPTDAWALAKLVKNPIAPSRFTTFRDMVMYKQGQWSYMPRPEAPTIVSNVLQPAVRFARDDCLDLPDTVIQSRSVELSKPQRDAYKTMMKELVLQLGNGTDVISAANEAVKLQKLLQICAGVVYDDSGEGAKLDCAPRIALVEEIIEQTEDKIIIFVPLIGAQAQLRDELAGNHSISVVNGSVSSNSRNIIFKEFQENPNPRILIAHPATMAHGLTLTRASTIIWFSPTMSNELYVQANGRIERVGKKHTSNVVHLVSTELETRVYRRLEGKQKIQGVLLDLISNQE